MWMFSLSGALEGRRIGDVARKPPACGKKRGEKKASHPLDLL
jgi:hypothetical protein